MLITIGAFDGFHSGHAELLRLCRENARGGDWSVVTFHPHPSEFIGKIHTLFTLREREIIRRILGIPHMFVLKFDDRLMNLSPEKFWRLLRERLNVDGIVMGSDFRFGHGREGSAESLREMAIADGILSQRVIIADVIDKAEYSSSTIREHITAGNVRTAANLLGYPYFVIGRVVHGNERGRTMHFPTANIEAGKGRVIPAYGVYSSAVYVNNSWHCGALSIGNNPTFGDIHAARAEVHLPDFSGDIYGHEVMMMILDRVRDIRKFSGKDELMTQITRDIDTCREIYREVMTQTDTKTFAHNAEKIYSFHEIEPQIINLI